MNTLGDPIPGDPSARVITELEAGTPLESLSQTLGISAREVVAALGLAALGDSESPGPALVQERPAHPRLAGALAQPALSKLFPSSARPAVLALSAGLFQIHDFWDASHTAAQEADDMGETRFSAYWHGIAHRREPDAGNAAYWFRRVGKHFLLPALGAAARPILEKHGDSRWISQLLGQGSWNTLAMIDLCTGARRGTLDELLARRLQRLEMQMLLEATLGALEPEGGN